MKNDRRETAAAAVAGTAAAATGAGAVVMALFPFAIPFLLLTVVFVAPLLVLPLVAAIPIAVLVAAGLAARGAWRALSGRRRRAPKSERRPEGRRSRTSRPRDRRPGIVHQGSDP